jgi:pyruvate, water dikinase
MTGSSHSGPARGDAVRGAHAGAARRAGASGWASPVDIEFACDGEDLYLLQCRPQGDVADAAPSSIPHDTRRRRALHRPPLRFERPRAGHHAHRLRRSRGYGLADREAASVGRVVGAPERPAAKRQFALIGPGRWGSRGDIKLGVSVTYADINNTAC